ncbi:MAG: helix-turn-helix domain-containing protein [Coprococcus sp.]
MLNDKNNQQIMLKTMTNSYFEDCEYMKARVKYPFIYYEGTALGGINICPQNNLAVIFVKMDNKDVFTIDSRSIDKAQHIAGDTIRYIGMQFGSRIRLDQEISIEDIIKGMMMNNAQELSKLFDIESARERQIFIYTYIRKSNCLNIADGLSYNIQKDIEASHGRIRVWELAEKYGYSERHINRVFSGTYGRGPKVYGRIQRIYETVIKMCNDTNEEITSYMEGFGYADQAHFQREFKWYTGITPGQFIRNMHKQNI